ncbi:MULTISPECIES: hypothetical protein [unclassified Thermosynechococcus]|nr:MULTISPECIES: hypothetical protein [unclassified Thermosynechococcus]HIK36130.1 hypothetical protein [Thermosynechococcus sp. M98_K2018_005]HIK47369.1 hypothetical protein [Thermosynechococcus sp. M55_K2018_012]
MKTAVQQERLQMLYWLNPPPSQMALFLHRNPSTMTRWLNAYRQGGPQQ